MAPKTRTVFTAEPDQIAVHERPVLGGMTGVAVAVDLFRQREGVEVGEPAVDRLPEELGGARVPALPGEPLDARPGPRRAR
jgi:hypothetical protein